MDKDEWMSAAQAHAGNDWAYFNEHYSFETAYEDGAGPLEAVVDCAAWLDD